MLHSGCLWPCQMREMINHVQFFDVYPPSCLVKNYKYLALKCYAHVNASHLCRAPVVNALPHVRMCSQAYRGGGPLCHCHRIYEVAYIHHHLAMRVTRGFIKNMPWRVALVQMLFGSGAARFSNSLGDDRWCSLAPSSEKMWATKAPGKANECLAGLLNQNEILRTS